MQGEAATRRAPVPALDQDWWRGAVIYQIYPRSFQDRTATASAISAASPSACPMSPRSASTRSGSRPSSPRPMKDFGYDVSDYCDVDPMFGTLADFDALVAAGARARPQGDDRPGALAHLGPAPWFQESRPAATTPRPTGMSGPIPSPTARRPTTGCRSSAAPPGNGTARRRQYYLHNFLTQQPDLNFH